MTQPQLRDRSWLVGESAQIDYRTDGHYLPHSSNRGRREVVMEIRGPHGRCIIFSNWDDSYVRAGEAVRAFTEFIVGDSDRAGGGL